MIINKKDLEKVVKESKTKKECFVKLKLHLSSNNSYKILNHYLQLYDITTTHFDGSNTTAAINKIRISLLDILDGKYPLYGSHNLKIRLLKDGIFSNNCDTCKLTEWNNKQIPLSLDHKDGNPTNHRIDNLRLLCPNCHAQTENYCGKNKQKSTYITKTIKSNLRGETKRNKTRERDDLAIKNILESNIDFTKHGWVTETSKIIGISPQKVNKWMKSRMQDFYKEKCFKRNNAG